MVSAGSAISTERLVHVVGFDGLEVALLEQSLDQRHLDGCVREPGETVPLVFGGDDQQPQRSHANLVSIDKSIDGSEQDGLCPQRLGCPDRPGPSPFRVMGMRERQPDDVDGFGITTSPTGAHQGADEAGRRMRIRRGVTTFGHAAEIAAQVRRQRPTANDVVDEPASPQPQSDRCNPEAVLGDGGQCAQVRHVGGEDDTVAVSVRDSSDHSVDGADPTTTAG